MIKIIINQFELIDIIGAASVVGMACALWLV